MALALIRKRLFLMAMALIFATAIPVYVLASTI